MNALPEVVRTALVEEEIAQHSPEVQAFYRSLIGKGNSPQFALMLATRSAPRMKGGDRIFCEGQRQKMEQMSPLNRNKIEEVARRAGISIAGKYYVGGLGKPSDPDAWVSTIDDVVSVCKKKGHLNCEGAANVKASRPAEPPKPVALAPQHVKEFRKQYVQSDPKLAEQIRKQPKKLKELDEQIVATHGSTRSRN